MPQEKSKPINLVFSGGQMRCIYSDDLLPLLDELGETEVTRASHVEPVAGGGWGADMSPMQGPSSLGTFTKRTDALSAEVDWLNKHLTT